MARMGSFNFSEWKKLQENLNKLQEEQLNAFVESCAKELAARLLAKVIKRTPVGDYSKEVEYTAKRDSKKHKKGDVYTKRINPSGRRGGTLRRGWVSESHQEAERGRGTPQAKEILEYANGLQVSHTGGVYTIEITNPVEYASYVEFGHRTTNHKGWVPGRFMMTISEQEIGQTAPKLLEKKIKDFLGDVLK